MKRRNDMVRDNNNRQFAVVTGASSGIGYELARQFGEHGFDLLIVSEQEHIKDAARAIEETGAAVESLQADLATYEGVEKLSDAIQDAGRRLDAIAINAGVGISGEFARETDLRDELRLIHLNVVSPVHLAKRILKDMIEAGGGRVLFTSSIAGTMPGPFEAVYNASKAFLTSFAQAVRNELKDTGVTITVLMPGATETEFFRRAGLEDTQLGAGEKDDPAEVARQGFEALMAGKDHVVAGSFKNKIQAFAGHVLPDPVMADLHRKRSEPGSAQNREHAHDEL
ncbi:MAG: SDR family NAD(P)-dependent oxidoreductase [Bryobacteraceae bacterium]